MNREKQKLDKGRTEPPCSQSSERGEATDGAKGGDGVFYPSGGDRPVMAEKASSRRGRHQKAGLGSPTRAR